MVILVARGVCVHIHAFDHGNLFAVLAVAQSFLQSCLQSCSPTLATYFVLSGGGGLTFLLFRLALRQFFFSKNQTTYVALLMCSSCGIYMKTRFEESLENTINSSHRLPLGLRHSCQRLKQNKKCRIRFTRGRRHVFPFLEGTPDRHMSNAPMHHTSTCLSPLRTGRYARNSK